MQILLDPGIQSKLISFAGLLVANECFFLHDIIAYIIQPIIKVQMTHPHGQYIASPLHSQHCTGGNFTLLFSTKLILLAPR